MERCHYDRRVWGKREKVVTFVLGAGEDKELIALRAPELKHDGWRDVSACTVWRGETIKNGK